MNFTRDVVGTAPAAAEALRTIDAFGHRRSWSFGELTDGSAHLAGTLQANGVRRGDVVMTLVGNRAEWVMTLLACFQSGAIALPCTEQLRAKDLALRLRTARPAAVVADERDLAELQAAAPDCPVILVDDPDLLAAAPLPPADLAADDPALMIFTSGTSGEPKAVVHGQRYLFGQTLQAEHWLDARPGELVWCTAAAGWSKSARNTFIAPWLRGARALLHEARFDPAERLDIIESEEVRVLCMAPTEYRVIAKRAGLRRLALRTAVAAGEALGRETVENWLEEAGVFIRDGYGQTETGAVTAVAPGDEPRPGSMGRPLPGIRVEVIDSQLHVDPGSSPTFFLHYLGHARPEGLWTTGDLVETDEEGYLWFRGRADDVIVSAGYRIGPTEVEEALCSHPAVADAAVVGAADDERGEIVRAVVVLQDGYAPASALTQALQEHVKTQTAPYKYPRIVEFADTLPRTASGKLRRAALR
ncbi:MAG TPA: AMP-binding protein [Solirubrobacteraceae bacterium]|jgi:acyl-coenzyme A synthetase/AMP-(fatty) acid ligase